LKERRKKEKRKSSETDSYLGAKTLAPKYQTCEEKTKKLFLCTLSSLDPSFFVFFKKSFFTYIAKKTRDKE
jgi:hypothetical protein